MTTNASLLTRRVGGTSVARALKQAGLKRINVSCDSLDPGRFAKIRRRADLSAVMAGIDEALAAGFAPLKMNVVVIRGLNDDEIVSFARFVRENAGRGRQIVVRFIEFMPLGETGEGQANWSPAKVMSSGEILDAIRREWPLRLVSSDNDHAPASRWRFKDGMGEIGVIPTMTNPFCANCNRLRLTADGVVMRCLFAEKEGRFSIRNILRRPGGCDDTEIADVFKQAVGSKRAGQDRDTPDIYDRPMEYLKGARVAAGVTMSQIGG